MKNIYLFSGMIGIVFTLWTIFLINMDKVEIALINIMVLIFLVIITTLKYIIRKRNCSEGLWAIKMKSGVHRL